MGRLPFTQRSLLKARVEVLLRDIAEVDRKYAVQFGALRRILASNWVGLPSQVNGNQLMLDVAAFAKIVKQGIAVAWVPPTPILSELMAADVVDLSEMLMFRESEILDNC